MAMIQSSGKSDQRNRFPSHVKMNLACTVLEVPPIVLFIHKLILHVDQTGGPSAEDSVFTEINAVFNNDFDVHVGFIHHKQLDILVPSWI